MPTLGLSMIVKNGASTLKYCFESVSGVVQQIVIADTGSTDDSREIARSFGATVIEVPWENHFAKARNAALAPMHTDWVIVLDADEELDASAKSSLPGLLKAKPQVGGYLTPIRNYVPVRFGRGWDRTTVPNDHRHPRAESAPAYFTHENCRLFRRDPEIYFIGRVHEMVEYRIQDLGLKLRTANFCIHHFGQLSPKPLKAKKDAAYCHLLELKVGDQPNDPSSWVQWGLAEYECAKNHEQALLCFEKAIVLEPRAAQAWFFKGMIQLEQGHFQESLNSFEKARGDHHNRALLEQLSGDALHNLGQLEPARMAYMRALELSRRDPVLLSKLGYTEVRLGRVQSGLQRLRLACQAAPDVAEVHERLMKSCIATENLSEAAEHAETIAKLESTPKWFLRAASIRAKLQEVDRAKAIVCQGLEVAPDSPELLDALASLNGNQGIARRATSAS